MNSNPVSAKRRLLQWSLLAFLVTFGWHFALLLTLSWAPMWLGFGVLFVLTFVFAVVALRHGRSVAFLVGATAGNVVGWMVFVREMGGIGGDADGGALFSMVLLFTLAVAQLAFVGVGAVVEVAITGLSALVVDLMWPRSN